MPAAVLNRRTAAAILGLLALGAVTLLPWWQQWVDLGGPVTRTGWNLWQASGIASAAVLLAAVALLADLWVSAGTTALHRYVPPLMAWAAALLLAYQAVRLRPGPAAATPQVGLSVVDGATAASPEFVRQQLQATRPDLHVVTVGVFRGDLGPGSYLGAALLLVIAVLLTLHAVRRPAVVPAGARPGAAPGGRIRPPVAALGIVVLGALSLLPWWRQWGVDPNGNRLGVLGWSVWQTSRVASTAVVVSMVALLVAGRLRGAGPWRLAPVATAWAAVLVLAAWARPLLPPPGDGSAAAGIQFVQAQTPEYLRLVDTSGPMLVPMEGSFHQGLGYPAYLSLAVALAVAVLLTVQALHRPAVEPAGPVAESAGPAAG